MHARLCVRKNRNAIFDWNRRSFCSFFSSRSNAISSLFRVSNNDQLPVEYVKMKWNGKMQSPEHKILKSARIDSVDCVLSGFSLSGSSSSLVAIVDPLPMINLLKLSCVRWTWFFRLCGRNPKWFKSVHVCMCAIVCCTLRESSVTTASLFLFLLICCVNNVTFRSIIIAPFSNSSISASHSVAIRSLCLSPTADADSIWPTNSLSKQNCEQISSRSKSLCVRCCFACTHISCVRLCVWSSLAFSFGVLSVSIELNKPKLKLDVVSCLFSCWLAKQRQRPQPQQQQQRKKNSSMPLSCRNADRREIANE